MSKIFDTYQATVVAEKAAQIKALGYTGVALYLFSSSQFKQAITPEDVKILKAHGLYLVTVWENGYPTKVDYFTMHRGLQDGEEAYAEAKHIGQPAGTPIYFAVDYDASTFDLPAIESYFMQVNKYLKQDPAKGYKVGSYGSGLVCKFLHERGLVDFTWLSQSTGFRGYFDWKDKANIVQGPTGSVLNMDVDPDTTNGNGGGWKTLLT